MALNVCGYEYNDNKQNEARVYVCVFFGVVSKTTVQRTSAAPLID